MELSVPVWWVPLPTGTQTSAPVAPCVAASSVYTVAPHCWPEGRVCCWKVRVHPSLMGTPASKFGAVLAEFVSKYGQGGMDRYCPRKDIDQPAIGVRLPTA
ncbi:MAG: hypothetical protein JRN06_03325 [Nitrososphaerota archaeon]|nr:hypothetical protein [Nitrososphaerota archaeon]MDG7023110.1 hypothetical protein [Nitrososphaerota archaeon]